MSKESRAWDKLVESEFDSKVTLPVGKLAKTLEVSRPTLNSFLKEWERAGRIKRDGKTIVILSEPIPVFVPVVDLTGGPTIPAETADPTDVYEWSVKRRASCGKLSPLQAEILLQKRKAGYSNEGGQ